MRVLQRFLSGPETCQYLPERQATSEYEIVSRLSPEEYEARMNDGWRKFGAFLFHPVCQSCRECRPVRISAEEFAPDRSQRRTLTRNADLTVRFAAPTADAVRLTLYNRYHAAQQAEKGWPQNHVTAREYLSHFVQNPIPAIEISVWEGHILRAVALTDITPGVVSGVYHYHDPDCRERGLGTFVMLHTIHLARNLGKAWAYFGFYVAGCGSMEYKSRFRPCELLGADGVWRAFP